MLQRNPEASQRNTKLTCQITWEELSSAVSFALVREVNKSKKNGVSPARLENQQIRKGVSPAGLENQ